MDLRKAMLTSNISLNKLSNKAFIQILENNKNTEVYKYRKKAWHVTQILIIFFE